MHFALGAPINLHLRISAPMSFRVLFFLGFPFFAHFVEGYNYNCNKLTFEENSNYSHLIVGHILSLCNRAHPATK